MVCEYQGNKYLSFPKKDASILNISDIGSVSEEDLSECDDDFTIHGAEVSGVIFTDIPGMCNV